MALTLGLVLQNRYRIVSLLGQGGMGAVYRVWDTRLNVPLALKEMVPQPGLDSRKLTQLRRQFEQEANVLARMKHPHLVRVTDFFEEAGNAYLVMDFVEGENLADLIAREGALDEAQVLAWANQLLDALAYSHSVGVIHRDVKPQNAIITPKGQVVLVDFGLVKLWDPDDPHTWTVMRGMGTPEYAPPEQYDAGMGHTGPQSDVYSVGATLYHALTGQPPPTATQRTASRSVFKPPRVLNPRISQQTEAAILRAMALIVEDRFATAEEMAAALKGERQALQREALRPERRPTRQPTKVMDGEQVAALSRRRVLVTRVLLPVAVLAVLILCVGLIWSAITAGGGMATAATPMVKVTATPSITKLPPTLTATPSRTPQPTVAPTATPTRTPKPTATSLPTLTPIPTSTPMPTFTSTPIVTLPPAPTAAPLLIAPGQAVDDPAWDTPEAYLDVIAFSSALNGETLQVTFTLRDVLPSLTFNKIGVPKGRVEYGWGVYVDVDGNTETGGLYGGTTGVDYALSAKYFVHEPDATFTSPIEESGIQVNTWRYEPVEDHYTWGEMADLTVDAQANTIVLEGAIPGISVGSRLHFRATGHNLGRDVPG